MKGWILMLCALVPVLAVVGLVTSSGGKYGSPKATFQTMVDAAKAGDQDGVMACFSRESQGYLRELEQLGKEMGATQNANVSDQFKIGNPVFGAERINGGNATLDVCVKGKREQVRFLKESGDWKIHMPELKMAVEMMKNMGGMMEKMMEDMGEAMEGSMEEFGQSFQDAMNDMERNR